MAKVTMHWHAEPLSVYEWSRLDLGAMLHRRPTFSLSSEDGVPIHVKMPCQMPRLVLADGTSLSVQAGEYSYSSPRDNNGPYASVEVGFPSTTPPETWKQYCEDWDTPTNTVYAYIPLSLVLIFIGAHGGIDREETFKDYEFKLR